VGIWKAKEALLLANLSCQNSRATYENAELRHTIQRFDFSELRTGECPSEKRNLTYELTNSNDIAQGNYIIPKLLL
jgi:hypothetical protein